MCDGMHLKQINMILGEGAIEILQYMKDGRARHFNDFKKLMNPRTKHVFSTKTILLRVRELVGSGALEKIAIKTKNGRDVLGYRITKEGLHAYELALKFEEKLKKILK